jgi:hypothetical protein
MTMEEIPDTPCGRAFAVVERRLLRDDVESTDEERAGRFEVFRLGWAAGLNHAVFGGTL